MLDAGELPGWVQSMMGHESLKMILEKYYSHIQNYQRDDGSVFMEKVFSPRQVKQQTGWVIRTGIFFTPILPQDKKREKSQTANLP